MLSIHFRSDKEYKENDFTIDQLRKDISSEIFENENKDLHYLLYYGSDLLEPDDWKELMILDEDYLPCDLIFVQLAANYFKRKIYLIPIHQPNTESDINRQEEDLEKKMLKVIPNEQTDQSQAFMMLYFPQGEFGPQSYFQSIFQDHDEHSSSSKFAWISYDLEILKDKLGASKKPNIYDDIDEEEESDEESEQLSSNKKTKRQTTHQKRNNNTKQKTGNAYNAVTMITPLDPTAKVIVNKTKKIIKAKVNKKDPIYQIAPGEGKVCDILTYINSTTFRIVAFTEFQILVLPNPKCQFY